MWIVKLIFILLVINFIIGLALAAYVVSNSKTKKLNDGDKKPQK